MRNRKTNNYLVVNHARIIMFFETSAEYIVIRFDNVELRKCMIMGSRMQRKTRMYELQFLIVSVIPKIIIHKLDQQTGN